MSGKPAWYVGQLFSKKCDECGREFTFTAFNAPWQHKYCHRPECDARVRERYKREARARRQAAWLRLFEQRPMENK